MTFAYMILSFNHPEWTERSVRSGLAQHSGEHIYLIHNGSEDRWIKRLQERLPNIHHLVIEKNRGFTGGTNFGLSHLYKIYDWVFFQTNDCLLLNSLTPPDKPGFFAPLIFKRNTGKVDSLGGHFIPHKNQLKHCKNADEFYQKKWFHKRYIPGTAFWLHKNIFYSVGLFDESLHTYWEDVDYSQRVLSQGLYLDIYPQTQLTHGVGKTCHKVPFYTNYLFQKNKRTISEKYTSGFLKPFALLYRLKDAFGHRTR
jgi:GT2 family glycosyltransferase